MNKDKLQAELLAKIKPGMKPSDLKKPSKKPPKKPLSPPPIEIKDEGYESDQSKSISTPPPTPTKQLKTLQKEVKF
jgi:hypothetical protein